MFSDCLLDVERTLELIGACNDPTSAILYVITT